MAGRRRRPSPLSVIRLPATVFLAAVMLLGLVAGGTAHAVRSPHVVPPDDVESEDSGLHLLREAAVAGRSRGYSGTQYVTSWGASGAASAVLEVRNVPGKGLTVRAAPSGASGPSGSVRNASGSVRNADPGTPAGGMSSPSEAMLEVLARNYRVVAAGEGFACGRPARLVNVLRPDGTAAARYWLDEAGGPVLRRELMDAEGRVVSAGAFVDLTLDPVARSAAPALAAGGLDLAELPRLAAGGWSFPGHCRDAWSCSPRTTPLLDTCIWGTQMDCQSCRFLSSLGCLMRNVSKVGMRSGVRGIRSGFETQLGRRRSGRVGVMSTPSLPTRRPTWSTPLSRRCRTSPFPISGRGSAAVRAVCSPGSIPSDNACFTHLVCRSGEDCRVDSASGRLRGKE